VFRLNQCTIELRSYNYLNLRVFTLTSKLGQQIKRKSVYFGKLIFQIILKAKPGYMFFIKAHPGSSTD